MIQSQDGDKTHKSQYPNVNCDDDTESSRFFPKEFAILHQNYC